MRIFLPRHEDGESHRAEYLEDQDTAINSSPAVFETTAGSVLVVEDETAIRKLIAASLRDLGCAVLEAADGPAGLRIVQSNKRVDLLVTDVGLPGMNGRQLADAARERRPDLPVVLITGYAAKVFEDLELAPGMEVLHKPFSFDVLRARVHTILKMVPAH